MKIYNEDAEEQERCRIFFKSVGERFRQARKKAGKTQKDMYIDTDIPEKRIREIENNEKGDISLRRLYRLAVALNIDICEIITGSCPSEDKELESEIQRSVKRLTPANQKQVLNFIKFLETQQSK